MGNKENYPDINECIIAIIGLGYVGLPLAIEFSKKQKCYLSGKTLNRKIIGFDTSEKRLEELKKGFDSTNEIEEKDPYKPNNLPKYQKRVIEDLIA